MLAPLRKQTATLAALLVLALWAARLIVLGAFPPFIDEGVHLHYAEEQRVISPFIHADEGRLLTTGLYALVQPERSGGLWLARVMTLLALLPGYAAIISSARLAAGRHGALFAGLLLLFSPYHHFFNRMAMADTLAASTVAIGLYFAFRLVRRAATGDAILSGLALFTALGFKVTALPYYGIPLAAVLTLGRGRHSRQARARWLLIALGTLLGLTAAFGLGLRALGYDYFGLFGHHNPDPLSGLLPTLVANLSLMTDTAAIFLSPGVVAVCGLGLLYLLIRRKFFLPLCLVVPAMIIALSARQSTRFYETPVTLLLLIGAVGLADIIRGRSRSIALLIAAGIVAWGLMVWLPFAVTAARQPDRLPLHPATAGEYISGDGSGFGLAEARWALLAHGATRVIGIMANCQGLRYLSLDDFPVECPRVNPNGEDIPALQALMESSRAPGVFVVLEDLPYAPDHTPGVISATIRHASGRPRLTIYALDPDYRPCNYCG
ncbi:MAG: hypothetical protein HPY64_04060 [Anaerolineae bacterium]|nr:hypothetical protein [Anaerolineae bacterium]